MKSIKLQSQTEATRNGIFTLAIVGEKQFDNDNCIEVSEQEAEELLSLTMGIKLEVVGKKKEVSKPNTAIEAEVIEANNEVGVSNEKEEAIKALNLMTNSQLRKLLKDHPIEETKSLTKRENQIAYLKSKI